MRAAITRAPRGVISVEQVDEPQQRSGSVFVDLDLALLTTNDSATYATGSERLFPVVQGSGGVGTLASGGGSLIVGSRVAIWPRLACGRCEFCAVGRRDACVDATTLGRDRDGTLAERVVVPRDNAVLLPSTLAPEVAAAAIDYADAWRLLQEANARQSGRSVAIVGSAPGARATYEIGTRMGADVALRETPEEVAEIGPLDAIIAVGCPVGPLVGAVKVEGSLVIRDPHLANETLIDAATLAERRARVIGAAPGGRQDFVEVLRWIAETRFLPPIGAAVRLDGVDRALRFEITEPVPVVID